jgi:hypothetical protein
VIDVGIESALQSGLFAVVVDTVLHSGWIESLDIVLQNDGDSDLFWMTVLGFGFGLYSVYRGVDTYRKE